MVLVYLQCGIVGQAGSSFDVEIDDDAKVSKLKGEIKGKNRETITCDAKDLQLFLAKKGEAWLTEADVETGVKTDGLTPLDNAGAPLNWVDLSEEDVRFQFTKEVVKAKKTPVHVLVLVPKQIYTGKRTRERDFFVDERMLKQPKVGGGDIQNFTMDKFPRMAHRVQKYKKVLERDAYRVIFLQLMGRVKEAFESRPPVHLVVTGNPGTGKSWFYIYCIFRLVLSLKDEAVELHDIDLVLNFDSDFQLYDAKTKEFVKLSNEEVHALCDQDRVLRLIEGKSSQLTGWSGVSILFASPGLAGMNDYAKVDSSRYIMPVWSLEELQDYNSLLDDELKLAEDVLISRYNKYGGIARFVFTRSETTEDTQLKQAIASFDATRILSYVKQNHAVRDDMYSHRVIAMIPSRDDYLDEYYLDFLSNHIAEELNFKMTDDSVKALSQFAKAQTVDDTGFSESSVYRVVKQHNSCAARQNNEIMCHRWFSIKVPKKPKRFKLNLRLHHHAM